MGYFVHGGKSLKDVLSGVAKNGMGCFVQGRKSKWDDLSGMAKNGMGCFVRLPCMTSPVS